MHLGPSPWLGFFSFDITNAFNSVLKGSYFKNFMQQVGTSYNSSLLFVHFMYSSFICFMVIVIVKVMSQSTMGTRQGDPWGGGGGGGELFALAHFNVWCSITNHFPSCLFPSIVDDTHIIGPPSIWSFAYEHFQTKLCAIGLSIQPLKCVAWPPSSLPPNFNAPSQFTTPFEGIRVLGVLLSTITFTSSFIKKTL